MKEIPLPIGDETWTLFQVNDTDMWSLRTPGEHGCCGYYHIQLPLVKAMPKAEEIIIAAYTRRVQAVVATARRKKAFRELAKSLVNG